ncbi:MAG: ABC-F family ATP-binding cassette domain-containing protein [Desulfobacterales bacterium]|nr:ABC-F family ATP-binding cassette domain-containing protein [Desulfobacterales bacterium]
MLRVENLKKSFGSELLFEGVSFTVNNGERVGLVGRNGHGKTTLFRILNRDEIPDEGIITYPRHYHIGCIKQEISFTEDTVLKEGMTGLRVEERGHYWKVEKILIGLGFGTKDFNRHPLEFSGGYQVRLNLVKVLVSEPDMLLLDEPTNYLDITSIRWIEKFLINWQHGLMLITHDRSFMDKVATAIIGIHRKKTRKIYGNTEKYYNQIAQEEEVYEKTRINDERQKKEVEQFIQRFRAKARLANMVQSRIKQLEKKDKKDKLEKIKNLEFSFRDKPFPAKYALTAKNISFSYDGQNPLISTFDITIKSGDRVFIIGKNGKGKTTLLKILAGKLLPNYGEIIYHPNLSFGLFEQTNIKTLVDTRSVYEEIILSDPDYDKQKARNICGVMMFEEDLALKKIGVLSGGEKSRVLIGKLLITPTNMLLLDEPTNHFDMQSCDSLISALDEFPHAFVMVTHNELFLHALATRLIVFKDEFPYVFEGTYQEFLEKDCISK